MLNWSPAPDEEVIQNVRVLLKTAPGSVPLSRALGTPQDVVDSPQSVVAAQLQADVIKAVRTYEPRVAVERVRLAADVDGRLEATVEIGAP